jgi:hypothetical protein
MAVVPPFMLAMSICVANREPIPHSGSATYDASLPVAENLRSGHEGLRQCETCCDISRCVRGPLVPLVAANQRRAGRKIANGSSGAPPVSRFCNWQFAAVPEAFPGRRHRDGSFANPGH